MIKFLASVPLVVLLAASSDDSPVDARYFDKRYSTLQAATASLQKALISDGDVERLTVNLRKELGGSIYQIDLSFREYDPNLIACMPTKMSRYFSAEVRREADNSYRVTQVIDLGLNVDSSWDGRAAQAATDAAARAAKWPDDAWGYLPAEQAKACREEEDAAAAQLACPPNAAMCN